MDGWKTMYFPFGSLPIFRCELLVSGRVYYSVKQPLPFAPPLFSASPDSAIPQACRMKASQHPGRGNFRRQAFVDDDVLGDVSWILKFPHPEIQHWKPQKKT